MRKNKTNGSTPVGESVDKIQSEIAMTAQASQLWKKKCLPLIWLSSESRLLLDADIAAHAETIYTDIYQHPYSGRRANAEFPRAHHGIAHVSRVAYYIPAFANLYRRYNPDISITEEKITLLQLAALFHDAAREGDNEDLWDKESAAMLYYYLRLNLNVEHAVAVQFAEVVANKDYIPGQSHHDYLKLVCKEDGAIEWPSNRNTAPIEKSIFQKLLHDADCLDIIRARDVFDAKYLDFYADHAKNNMLALDEMAQFIAQARGLIELQGDTRHLTVTERKKAYDVAGCYQKTVELVTQRSSQFRVLHTLHNTGKLIPNPKEVRLLDTTSFQADSKSPEYTSIANVHAAMREKKLFVRGVGVPSMERKKTTKSGEDRSERFADLEIRKILRRPGIATRTSKPNRFKKEGNPSRSVSCLLGLGAGMYSNVALGFLNLDPTNFISVLQNDSHTGRAKKKYLRRLDNTTPEQRRDQAVRQLDQIALQTKLGGGQHSTMRGGDNGRGFNADYSEIITRLLTPDIIVYTSDPVVHQSILRGGDRPYHPHVPLLEALYLRERYKHAVESLPDHPIYAEIKQKTALPLFEYSALQNTILSRPIPTEDEIFSCWQEVCSSFYKDARRRLVIQSLTRDAESAKVVMCYSAAYSPHDAQYPLHTLDEHYSEELKDRINQMILEKEEEYKQRVRVDIHAAVEKTNDSVLKLDQHLFDFLLHDQALLDLCCTACQQLIDPDSLKSMEIQDLYRLFLVAQRADTQENLLKIKNAAQAIIRKNMQDTMQQTCSFTCYTLFAESINSALYFINQFGLQDNQALRENLNHLVSRAQQSFTWLALEKMKDFPTHHMSAFATLLNALRDATVAIATIHFNALLVLQYLKTRCQLLPPAAIKHFRILDVYTTLLCNYCREHTSFEENKRELKVFWLTFLEKDCTEVYAQEALLTQHLMSDDLEFFSQVMRRFGEADMQSGFRYTDMGMFCRIVENIKANLPGRNFSQEQLTHVKQALDSKWQRFFKTKIDLSNCTVLSNLEAVNQKIAEVPNYCVSYLLAWVSDRFVEIACHCLEENSLAESHWKGVYAAINKIHLSGQNYADLLFSLKKHAPDKQDLIDEIEDQFQERYSPVEGVVALAQVIQTYPDTVGAGATGATCRASFFSKQASDDHDTKWIESCENILNEKSKNA